MNIPLPTIDISSINISFSFFSCVFSLSLSSAQYSKPLLAGILKAECNVLALILNAALPVGAFLTTFTSSGFSPVTVLRYLIDASYKGLVTVLLPMPAPPLKNNLRGSSLVLIECNA